MSRHSSAGSRASKPPAQHSSRPQETRLVPAGHEARLRVALVFPNTYWVGMSNLGLHVLYRLISSNPHVFCDRFFVPAGTSTARGGKTPPPPRGVETSRPLGSFHVIACTISFENDYPALVGMLHSAGIPLLQQDRREHDPLVIGGGICTWLNPEPLAPFFDLFLLGDAEASLPLFLEIARTCTGPRKWHRPDPQSFAQVPGVYIPSARDPYTVPAGARIVPSRVPDLDPWPGTSAFISPNTEFSNMALIEVSRGCPHGCHFCAVGNTCTPYRCRSLEKLKSALKPLLNRNIRIGLLGSAVSDYPHLREVLQDILAADCPVSIASLRADVLDEELVQLLKGQQSFTIAPEAGTERLRTAIGKHLSNATILQAVRLMASCGIASIKLYFMIGLPGETADDVEGIIHLTRAVRDHYYQETGRERQLRRISLSISPFVPKPFTPLQWHPYEQVGALKQKIRHITRGLASEKKITVTADLPKWGYFQTLLGRGDRRVADLLHKVCLTGMPWQNALREVPWDPDGFVYRTYDEGAALPWDFIDHGQKKGQLWRKYQKALKKREVTED